MSEIVKSEYNALDEQGNYKTYYFKTSADLVEGLDNVATSGSYNDLKNKPTLVNTVNGKTGDVVVDTLPVGTIISYAGNTTPNGFLDCSGASLNPNTYKNLFNEIGTGYGGDGITTFKLPNMGSNVISEVSTGNLSVKGNGKTLGLTNGTDFGGLAGGYLMNVNHLWSLDNCYNKEVSTNGYGGNFVGGALGITTDGSKSGMVVPVTATKTTVKYCIKY